MQLSDVFLQLGEEHLRQLVRTISIGKLRTFQLYDRFKTRTHLSKVNTENLRKATPRFWDRLNAHDEEFSTDLSQAILISHLDMIVAVLDFTGVPHQDGFFEKDLDAKSHLSDGWETRVYDQFKDKFPPSLVLFYINHLGLELGGSEHAFLPAA